MVIKLIILLLTTFSLNVKSIEVFRGHNIEITDGIYGAGEFIIPCEIESIKQSCKIDTGASVSILSNLKPGTDRQLIRKVSYVSSVSGESKVCDLLKSKTDFIFGSLKMNQPTYLSCSNSAPKNLIGQNHLMLNSFQIDFANQRFVSNIPLDDFNTVKPFFKDKHGRIYADMKILRGNLQKNITVMIDTGAAITTVSKDFVVNNQEFFYILNGQSFENLTDTHSNPIQSLPTVVSAIKLDQKMIIAPYVLAIDFRPLIESAGFQVDMIIGANVLKETNRLTVFPKLNLYRID